MAIKKNRLDELDFDNLDFDSIDEPQGRERGGKREALTEIATSFAQGAKDSLINPTHIRRLASQALPKGYGTAINTGFEAYRGGRELYNIAAQELKPALPIMRRAVAKLNPTQKSYIPKPIAKKLEEFAKGGQEYKGPTQAQLDDTAIAASLGDIFKVQMEQDARSRAEDKAEERIREDVRMKQSDQMVRRLEEIRLNTERVASYQDQITLKFQQKSLELQYRSYFALRDILRTQVSRDARDKVYFDQLVKNTGLPDIQKQHLHESAKQEFRERLMGNAANAVSGFASSFLDRMVKNFGSRVRDTAGGFRDGLEAWDAMNEMQQMQAEFGQKQSAGGMISNVLGGLIAEYGSLFGAPLIRSWLEKNPRIKGFGDTLRRVSTDLPGQISSLARSNTEGTGLKSNVIRWVKDSLPRGGFDPVVGTSPLLSMKDAQSFDKQAHRSIVEVIPGFLSRIHLEILRLRTGTDGGSPLRYDWDKGAFGNEESVKESIKDRIFKPEYTTRQNEAIDKMVAFIDPEGKLTDDERRQVAKHFFAEAVQKNAFNPRSLFDLEERSRYLSGDLKTRLAEISKSRFYNADGRENRDAVATGLEQFELAKQSVMDPTAIMQGYHMANQGDLLRELGLTKRQGNQEVIDFDKYVEYLINSKRVELQPDTPTYGEQILKDALGAAKNKASGVWNSDTVKGVREDIHDVYVNTENQPRILSVKMKAKKYYDAISGAVIEKISDIRNAVIDKDTGKVVLVPDEFKNTVDEKKQQITHLLSQAANWTRQKASGISDSVAKFFKTDTVAQNNDAIMSPQTQPTFDVFEAGSSEPVIQASKLKAGEYADAVTGQTIERIEDIQGQVVDKKTGEIVLSARQLAAGLFDRTGRRVTGLLDRAKKRAMAMLGIDAKVALATGEVASGASEVGTTRTVEVNGELVQIGNQQVELLKAILEVLITNPNGGGPGFLDRAVLGTARLTGKGLAGAGRLFGMYLKGVGTAVGGIGRGAGAILGGTARGVGAVGGAIVEKFRNPLERPMDMYVDKELRIRAQRLRNGLYRFVDQNGNPTDEIVKNLKQIQKVKKAIIDVDKMEIVVTADEIPRLIAKLPNTIIRGAISAINNVGGSILGMYGNLAALPFKAVSLAAKGVKEAMGIMTSDQVDVYVPDKKAPVLLARDMKAGKYFNVKDGKIGKQVRGWKDIHGAVVERMPDGQFETRLTEEEAGKIVDSRGKTLKTPLAKLVGAGVGLVTNAISYLAGAAGAALKGIGGVFGLGVDLLAGTMKRFGAWFNPKEFGAQSKKQTELLQKIYDLLFARIPENKKIREGSWQDQFAERAAKKKELEENKQKLEAAKASGGGFASMLAKAKGLFGFGRNDDDEEDEDDDDGSFLEDAADAAEIYDAAGDANERRRERKDAKGRGKRRRRKRGRLGRLFDRAKGLGSRGVEKLGGASRVGGLAKGIGAGAVLSVGAGYAANRMFGEDSTAAKTVGTTANVAGAAMTASAVSGFLGGPTIGGLLGSAGLTIGGGALATIGLPVLIGAAIIGGVGYLAWKGYKKYKYGTYSPLRSFRVTQYGFPWNDSSMGEKIAKLEQRLEPLVKMQGGGYDIYPDESFKQEDLYKEMGLDDGWFTNNAEERARFDKWFNGRFKPVYLKWISAVRAVASGTLLNDADELDADKKKQILDAVKNMSPHVYEVRDNPFDDEPLTIGAKEVEDAAIYAASVIEKSKTAGGKMTEGLKRLSGAAMSMGPMGMLGSKVFDAQQKKDQAKTVAGLKGAGAAAVAGAVGATIGMAASTEAIVGTDGKSAGHVSNLQAVRYRTYGLTEMASDRVKNLRMLEEAVLTDTKFSGGVATFAGDPSKYAERYMSYFGMSFANHDQRSAWTMWFKGRFLATWLTYATAVMSITKSVDTLLSPEKVLKADQLVDVATKVVASRMEGGSRSVWSFRVSPWSVDEVLNTDDRTTYPSITALKQAVKNPVANEPKAEGGNAATKKAADEIKNATDAAGDPSKKSMMDRMKSWLGDVVGGGKQLAGDVWDGIKNAGSWLGDKAGAAASWLGDTAWQGAKNAGAALANATMPVFGGAAAALGAIGRAVSHPGRGTGGDINQIPHPDPVKASSGNQKERMEAVAPVIAAAARIAGVDPALMMTMASIESGFRPFVKAATSSARGLYQFINSTWREMMKRYGAKYGISPVADQNDARANALLGAEFLRENASYLEKKLGRKPTDTELYIAHFMGPGGAVRLLKSDPSANAVSLFPKEAAANKSIFFNKDGSPRSIAGVIQELDRRVSKHRLGEPAVPARASFAGVTTKITSTEEIVPTIPSHRRPKPEATNVPVAHVPATVPDTGGYTTTTANGPTGGLGGAANDVSTVGYGATLAAAANGMDPVKPSVPSPIPVPSLESSKSLKIAATAGTEDGDKLAIVQQHVNNINAKAQELAGQQAVNDLNASMAGMATLLSKQVDLQQQIVTGIMEVVKSTDSMHKGVKEAIAGISTGSSPTDNVASTKPGGPVRGQRPAEAVPKNPPISLRRQALG